MREAGLKHVRTQPYTPRTNGKAERFIQTFLREWAYARPYTSSAERHAAIQPWTDAYNLCRPHSALGGQPPWSKLNNLLGNDSSTFGFADPGAGLATFHRAADDAPAPK